MDGERRARSVTELPLVAYPNAGRSYDPETKTWSGETSACRFEGARVVGGCCGWGPSAIRALGASMPRA